MSGATSQVRVGVRIRPLTDTETSEGGKCILSPPSHPNNKSLSILKRQYTFDSVYDSNVSQSEMYDSVGGSEMLEQFLDGYNATIMAYGQTGSGKTFTMGSEADYTALSKSMSDCDSNQGLIPRFMADVFSTLRHKKHSHANTKEGKTTTTPNSNNKSQQLIDYKVTATFLEVYGEDIFDLLSEDTRDSLSMRDDSNGEVVIAGLQDKKVTSAEDALQALHRGTLNRTTAATLMNKKSSRSHAVFTINLVQTFRECDDSLEGGESMVDIITKSKFTFVDLAGSERMKKTGAEGERAREGIKINEGLLALGNVINALGDEERILKGDNVGYVPYRQSKLTRLLQDALGGNSQTLFLACVSPSDTNASETISTLGYANRARNIRNAPTKNVDAKVAELQRLYSLTDILERELVKARFGNPSVSNTSNGSSKTDTTIETLSSSDSDDVGHIGEVNNGLLDREDVKRYLTLIHEKAEKNRESPVTVISNRSKSSIPSTIEDKSRIVTSVLPSQTIDVPVSKSSVLPNSTLSSQRQNPAEEVDESFIMDVNPDEDIALLEKVLELQSLDQEFNKEKKKDEEEIKEVQGEIEQQEGLLLQLKENLKGYQTMKERFETMMVEVQELEVEKSSLASQLDNVQLDPTKGSSTAIRKRLEKVESNLARARSEARKHQQLYRKAEQEAQKCKVLQKKIDFLKHGKVALIKKQKEVAAKYRQSTQATSREIHALKKKERKTGQKMTKLEADVQKHKANLDKRKMFSDKLAEKLKQTESHLTKLLSLRKREMNKRSEKSKKMGPNNTLGDKNTGNIVGGYAPESEELASLKFLLHKLVSDRVSYSTLKVRYERRVSEYSDLMRTLVKEMKELEATKKALISTENEDLKKDLRHQIYEHNQNLEELELRIEVVTVDLESIRDRIPNVVSTEETTELSDRQSKFELDAFKMVSRLSAPLSKSLLWDVLDEFTKSEVQKSLYEETLQRKEAVLHSLEKEIQGLNQKLIGLSEDLEKRRTLASAVTESTSTINMLQSKEDEIKRLNDKISSIVGEKSSLEKRLSESTMNLEEKALLLSTASEKLTLVEAAVKLSDESSLKSAKSVLDEIQSLWKTVGISGTDRESARIKIGNCLQDTCERTLNEAYEHQGKLQSEINESLSLLEVIYASLGRSAEFEGVKQSFTAPDLTKHLENIVRARDELFPMVASAIERRSKVISEVMRIVKSMDTSKSKISDNLARVLKCPKNKFHKTLKSSLMKSPPASNFGKIKRAKIFKDVEEMMKALEGGTREGHKDDDDTLGVQRSGEGERVFDEKPNMLSDNFLDACEEDIRHLKRLRSEVMISNQAVRDEARKLTLDMHLRGRDLLSLSLHSLKKRSKELPPWWDPKIAEEVCRSIINKDYVVGLTATFSKHLKTVHESLKNVSTGRVALSKTLILIIESAHSALLATVAGEIDAKEAHSSFHEALSRLPPLSKEHVHACIDEMKILTEAVDAMAQSEVEALTVVWEALDVSSNARGNFWVEVDESSKVVETNTTNPFDNVRKVCTVDIEEWLLIAMKDAIKIHQMLNTGLLKLNKIHQEVEKLRSKQDLKSKVISLDSEIGILSSKLLEFEEKAGNTHRLVAKRMNSSALLKEERFRKQMQTNFASKLQNLGKTLKEWEDSEGSKFDSGLLSEAVNILIQNSNDDIDWVERRTAFMHLKTVKQNRRKPMNGGTRSQSPLGVPATDKSGHSKTKTSRTPLVKAVSDPKLTRGRGKSPSFRSGSRSRLGGRPNSANSSRSRSRSNLRQSPVDSSSSSRNRSNATRSMEQRTKRGPIITTASQDRGPTNGSQSLEERNILKTNNSQKHASSKPVEKKRQIKVNTTINDDDDIGTVLPFGHILTTTPTQKENKRHFRS